MGGIWPCQTLQISTPWRIVSKYFEIVFDKEGESIGVKGGGEDRNVVDIAENCSENFPFCCFFGDQINLKMLTFLVKSNRTVW